MPERTVGVLPDNNYVTRVNASHKAIYRLVAVSNR